MSFMRPSEKQEKEKELYAVFDTNGKKRKFVAYTKAESPEQAVAFVGRRFGPASFFWIFVVARKGIRGRVRYMFVDRWWRNKGEFVY